MQLVSISFHLAGCTLARQGPLPHEGRIHFILYGPSKHLFVIELYGIIIHCHPITGMPFPPNRIMV